MPSLAIYTKAFFLFFFILIISALKVHAADVRTVYITSDDGPWAGTENIIKTMIAKQAPVTMFFIGHRYTKAKPEMRQFLAEARKSPYVQIANHSYSHAWGRYGKFYHTPGLAQKDFIQNAKVLGLDPHEVTHARLPARNVFRLPGLKKNDTYVTSHCKKPKEEYEVYDEVYDGGKTHIYGWDVYWHFNDKGKPSLTPEQIVAQIDKKFASDKTVLKDKCVIILHDVMFMSKYNGPGNLSTLVDLLRARGYKLDLIKNYYEPRQDYQQQNIALQ